MSEMCGAIQFSTWGMKHAIQLSLIMNFETNPFVQLSVSYFKKNVLEKLSGSSIVFWDP